MKTATWLAVVAAVSIGSAHADPRQLLALTPSTGGGGGGIAFVQTANGGNCSTASTCVTTLTGTTLGSLLVVTPAILDGISSTITSVTTDNGTSCAHSTNATATLVTGGNNFLTDVFYCQNNAAGGTVHVTAHASDSPSILFFNVVGEFSGAATSSADVGVGNNANASGVTTLSVATNGNLTQNNQLIVSIMMHDDSPSACCTPGGNQTSYLNDFSAVGYQITDSTGTAPTHSYTWTGSTNNVMSIAAFKHP